MYLRILTYSQYIPTTGENDIIETCTIKSENSPNRRRRGRPRKNKKNFDEALENLCCDDCTFIGVSPEAVMKHRIEVHGDASLSQILPSIKDEINDDAEDDDDDEDDDDWNDLGYDTSFLGANWF